MKINPPMNSNSIQANADALPFANLAKHSCSTQQNEKGDAAQGLRSFFDRSTPKTGHLPVIAALITTLSLLPVAGAEPNPASNLPLRPSDHRVHSAAVTEHGAIGDAKTLNTRTIQAAIDAVAANGGGVVHFPPGNYLCGAVSLKSRVTLSLEAGAILLGSTNEADYKSVAKSALITGDDLDDVAIIGRGTIDGQGAAFPRQGFRPMNIQIANSRNVLIEGIKLRNAASWVQKYARCEDLVIRGIQVESLSNANNDGLDIDSCRNVRVTDSRIWSGDDAFVFKSTYDRPCENVVIANCIASSHCNAFKLGIESYGGFMNITIANCVVIPKADGTSVPKADIVLWSRDFNGDGLEDAAGETAAEIDQTWYAAYDQTLAQNSIVAYTPALTVTYTNPGFALTLCRLHLARDCWRQIQCAFCGFAADHRRCFSLGMGRPRPPAASVSSPVGRRLAVQLSRR